MTAWRPNRRRRQPTLVMTGLIVAGVVAAALVAAGVAAWWLDRRTGSGKVARHNIGEAAFDRVALDRAADEGMAPPPDLREERPVADALPGSNGVVRGLAGIL
jgi:hypothetical protein